jgi:hypothetical protein
MSTGMASPQHNRRRIPQYILTVNYYMKSILFERVD